jgi:hypothetical protein
MNPVKPKEVELFADKMLADLFRQSRDYLSHLGFEEFIAVSPFTLLLRDMSNVGEIVISLLDISISKKQEEIISSLFADFAAFIVNKSCNGYKSTEQGVDLEFINRGIHYVVSVKSGTNWGNSSQQNKLEQDLKNAVARIKQSQHGANVQPVLGICYGKTKTSYVRGYLKIVGQNFWYLISEDEHLYTDIIEPIGHRAKEHNKQFLKEKGNLINRFTKLFIDKFCADDGAIDWVKLVEFNSGNFDLNNFIG